MADFTLKFNIAPIIAAVEQATQSSAIALDIELRRAITDPVWTWPRGETPRDIVLTGKLRDKQVMVRLSGTRYRWRWGVPYSLIVRNGAVLRNGTVLPARKWDELAIQRTDIPKVFSQSFRINYKG
jgi:hypothetical protein